MNGAKKDGLTRKSYLSGWIIILCREAENSTKIKSNEKKGESYGKY
jgi:hypothetical protein